jgi:hypothetical protein
MAERRGRMARHRGKRAKGGSRTRHQKDTSSSSYFTQPGKRGAVIVLRKPCGNRISPKVCGTMPSRVHAKMLIDSLQRAESVVKDLFMEATDDGIEALEAILVATCEDVLRRGPKVELRAEAASDDEEQEPESDESSTPEEDDEDPYAE